MWLVEGQLCRMSIQQCREASRGAERHPAMQSGNKRCRKVFSGQRGIQGFGGIHVERQPAERYPAELSGIQQSSGLYRPPTIGQRGCSSVLLFKIPDICLGVQSRLIFALCIVVIIVQVHAYFICVKMSNTFVVQLL
jgi:hypothetical protein